LLPSSDRVDYHCHCGWLNVPGKKKKEFVTVT
jgi:hypothetical protein